MTATTLFVLGATFGAYVGVLLALFTYGAGSAMQRRFNSKIPPWPCLEITTATKGKQKVWWRGGPI